MSFQEIASHIQTLSGAVREALLALPAAERTALYPGSGGWTRGELLGHLVDSAINNQQRFVRALIAGELVFPNYEQMAMVQVQHYAEADWTWLVEHWWSLNRHIVMILGSAPPERAAAPCTVGSNSPVTLEYLAQDYVAHMEHHLRQLLPQQDLPYSTPG
ncbi:MAG: DinB family protein [Acidobacteria bacterium]|nr:DinB family protein [Acidobacteriota bacterium]